MKMWIAAMIVGDDWSVSCAFRSFESAQEWLEASGCCKCDSFGFHWVYGDIDYFLDEVDVF